jgi:hypothetical protein
MYGLVEHSGGYPDRTRENILDADATLIFAREPLDGGSKLTANLCRGFKKPRLVVQHPMTGRQVLEWLEEVRPRVLNIAGNRESKSPGIHDSTLRLLVVVFKAHQ